MKRGYSVILLLLVTMLSLPPAAVGAEDPAPGETALTLDEAVRIALEKNSDIKMARSAVDAARARARSAGADLLAKFRTGYSVTRLSDDPEFIFQGGPPLIAGSKPNYRWTVGFAQPIFTGFALTTVRQLAELGVDKSLLEQEEIKEAIILGTKEAYFQHLLAARFRDVARDSVTRLKAHAKDAEAMFDAGVIPRNDLLKSQVQLAQAEQELVRARNRMELTGSHLNLLLKREINGPLKLTDILSWSPYPLSLEASLEKGIAGRPEVRAAEVAARQAAGNVRLERSRYFPDLLLVGEYYRQGDRFDVNGNGFTNTENASIGVQAQWTFFEWGKTGADVSRAFYEKERALEARNRLKDEISLQIKQSYLDLETAASNIDTSGSALEQARENYRITDVQYKEQITTSTEVLDAETLLAQAETNYYGALYGYNIALASLERAMGAGRKHE